MSFELIITSLVGLISGVISLCIDPKEKKNKVWKLVFLSLIILSAISTVYFGYQKENESKATEVKKNSQIKNLTDNLSLVNNQNIELLKIVNKMNVTVDTTREDIRNFLAQLGWSRENLNNLSQNKINQSLQASQSLKTISGNSDQRRAITVQYFPKNVDPAVVRSRLEALGISLSTSASQLPGVPTNAIWFGSGVDINTAKAVAYTLIGAGVELKMIRQFNNSQDRERIIQVGGDGECVNRPTLTVEKIRNIQEFPQQSAVINCQAAF